MSTSLTALSSDILVHLLNFLPPTSLIALGMTCHKLYQLSKDELYWKCQIQQMKDGLIYQIILKHDLNKYFTWRRIYSSVVTWHCKNCGCSTPYLFLLTNTKVCRNCLETCDDYRILTKSMALSQFLLNEKDIANLPKGVIGQKGDKSFMGYVQIYSAKAVDQISIKKWGSREKRDQELEKRKRKSLLHWKQRMELYTIFNKSYRNKRGLESSGNLKKSKSRSISKKKLLLATTTTTTTTSARTKTKIPKRPPTMPIILKDIKDTIIDNYDRFSMAINLGFVEKDTGCFYEPIQCGFCDETKKIASMTEEEAIFEKPCNIKYPSIYTIKTLKDHISKCHIDFYKKITNVRINIIQNC
ncbi:hypothetical protein H8356DRAFT_983064 [Neocallimastix lanati (nom. inval.)]|uniref:F-box domain-containing protein n=1 Tax=Neocallimastix californiae TaxID=1754190 RepID=A0A1Y2BQH0_9FUNG|nr:hypothetical protein H8356DRAFT_983064 [Neocallimastix sp. JGI-2020a]ORY36405.1 hypothetical protein LY90DRAFT_673038 [Neocallimastix californiae]|eukprot:ORY36405.1 hypothetical protein LY90DRAFT_673038 [Neocallimastix californiae]